MIAAAILYSTFSAAALLWMRGREPGEIWRRLGHSGGAGGWLAGVAAGGAIGLAVVAATAALGLGFGWARTLERRFAAVLGRLTAVEILALAVASALGEELLFRGALQPALGWAATGLLFGAVHVPVGRDLWPWPLFAAAMGFLFGAEEAWTGTLAAPMATHAVVNGLNLWRISSRAGLPGEPPSTG